MSRAEIVVILIMQAGMLPASLQLADGYFNL